MLDVHNRDVIAHLIKLNVRSIFEFPWLSQLRYYQGAGDKSFNVLCKCINAIQNYGFEYLGNSTRYESI